MNEELDKIEKNHTCKLVPRPHDKIVIGTKWVFENKLNENGKVIRKTHMQRLCSIRRDRLRKNIYTHSQT